MPSSREGYMYFPLANHLCTLLCLSFISAQSILLPLWNPTGMSQLLIPAKAHWWRQKNHKHLYLSLLLGVQTLRYFSI